MNDEDYEIDDFICHTPYFNIAKVECEKYKDWFEENGYEPLISNPVIHVNHKFHITISLAYTETTDKLEWCSLCSLHEITVGSQAATPEQAQKEVKAAMVKELQKLRDKIDCRIREFEQ